MSDVEVMTTPQVASRLGINPRSVPVTMRRKGIVPLYREPGVKGSSYVYPAAAVIAHWPVPAGSAVYGGMTFAERGAEERITTVSRRWDVVDAEPMNGERGRFTPLMIVLSWFNYHDGLGWIVSGVIYGPRKRQDGSAGSEAKYVIRPDMADNPAWVGRWIDDNTPPPVD